MKEGKPMTTNWHRTITGVVAIELSSLAHYDLSVIQIGMVWRWQVTQAGRDVTEGVSNTSDAAKQAAETSARALWENS
jgi:regulator of protease activity HflC (stomatin/prohibitin superfamily)